MTLSRLESLKSVRLYIKHVLSECHTVRAEVSSLIGPREATAWIDSAIDRLEYSLAEVEARIVKESV